MRRRSREANDTILSPIDGCLYRLFIEQDEYPQNPRKDFDHIGTIISWSGGYHSPDDAEYMPKMQSWCDFEEVYSVHKPVRISERESANCEWSSLVEMLQDNGQYIILPLRHDRDGLAVVSRGCLTNGYACMSRSAILENWGKPGAKIITRAMRGGALACLNAEIEEYNQWANGEVYFIDIDRIAPDEFGEFDEEQEGEELDSCCGLYGFDYAREEGLSILKSLASGSSAEENARNLTGLRELASI